MKRKVQKKLRRNKRREKAEELRQWEKMLGLGLAYGMGPDAVVQMAGTRGYGKARATQLLLDFKTTTVPKGPDTQLKTYMAMFHDERMGDPQPC